jgi:DNA polymerase III alpha subunit
VAEIAGEARKQNWPTAVRGSAASSLVAYLLGISDLDPLWHGLRLERFMHPGRADLPDIDLECADQVRRPLWNAVVRRYGVVHVARVGSIHRLGRRPAWEAAALAHGLPAEQAALLLEELGEEGIQGLQEGAGLPAAAPHAWSLPAEVWGRVAADARLLAGRPRALEPHPSGFVLTAVPAEDVLPLERGPGGVGLSQFNQDAVDEEDRPARPFGPGRKRGR